MSRQTWNYIMSQPELDTALTQCVVNFWHLLTTATVSAQVVSLLLWGCSVRGVRHCCPENTLSVKQHWGHAIAEKCTGISVCCLNCMQLFYHTGTHMNHESTFVNYPHPHWSFWFMSVRFLSSQLQAVWILAEWMTQDKILMFCWKRKAWEDV